MSKSKTKKRRAAEWRGKGQPSAAWWFHLLKSLSYKTLEVGSVRGRLIEMEPNQRQEARAEQTEVSPGGSQKSVLSKPEFAFKRKAHKETWVLSKPGSCLHMWRFPASWAQHIRPVVGFWHIITHSLPSGNTDLNQASFKELTPQASLLYSPFSLSTTQSLLAKVIWPLIRVNRKGC